MSTADKIDMSLSGGLSGLRTHMKKMQETIKATNEKADTMEKEREAAHNNYCRVVGRQQAIKQKILDTEANMEKTEKRMKETEARLQEKEQFLKESKVFANSLKIVSPSENAVVEKEEQVNVYKNTYHQNYERYQKAKAKKIDLEQRFEITENKSQEITRKLNALKLELEYNLVEEGRRSEGCKESIDSAFKTEKSCLDLQRGLDAVMKRKEIATRKINELESNMTRSEDSLEATNFERRRIEATIREILLNAKDQYKE